MRLTFIFMASLMFDMDFGLERSPDHSYLKIQVVGHLQLMMLAIATLHKFVRPVPHAIQPEKQFDFCMSNSLVVRFTLSLITNIRPDFAM